MSKNFNLLSEFITTLPGFQNSINLKYDLESTDKIRNYIPTSSALEIIEEILLSINYPTTMRSRILIGPYGKGKSHLVLMMIGLIYYKDTKLFNTILSKVKESNADLYQLILDTVRSKEKMLPVIVSGSSLNLNQSFLLGLQNALRDNQLLDEMPETYFNAACEMINLWKCNYNETYDKFHKLIGTSVDEFLKELYKYNQAYYDKFVEIYPLLTSGGEFNPLKNIDIVDLYSEVSAKIKDKGYRGMFVVYDEFSKFLEGIIDRNSSMEIKLLQDFAEKCNRSGENQMHLMLISHKNISNYVDKLPKEKVDSWKAVGERFKTIEINNFSDQTYEIMSNVIVKKQDKWELFIQNNQHNLSNLESLAANGELFLDIQEKVKVERI